MLPKDVLLIIYRYIHQSLLNDVIAEYNTVWMSEFTHDGEDIFYRCNYRDLSLEFFIPYTDIYSIYSGETTGELPFRYCNYKRKLPDETIDNILYECLELCRYDKRKKMFFYEKVHRDLGHRTIHSSIVGGLYNMLSNLSAYFFQ